MASFKRVVGVAGQVLRYEDRGQTTEIRDHDVHCFLDLQPLPFHLLPFLIAHCVVLGLCRILASYETRRGVTKFLESRCVAGPGTKKRSLILGREVPHSGRKCAQKWSAGPGIYCASSVHQH